MYCTRRKSARNDPDVSLQPSALRDVPRNQLLITQNAGPHVTDASRQKDYWSYIYTKKSGTTGRVSNRVLDFLMKAAIRYSDAIHYSIPNAVATWHHPRLRIGTNRGPCRYRVRPHVGTSDEEHERNPRVWE